MAMIAVIARRSGKRWPILGVSLGLETEAFMVDSTAMKIGISEFTFGYAFLFEQTRAHWADLQAAPILPSLVKEKDEGWDAHLPLVGTDFYYQFKLSDYLWGSNAKYRTDGTYTSAYYRLRLHHHNNNRQHQRLRLCAQTCPNTFYVAPEFQSVDEFNAAFMASEMRNRSRIIPVALCPDVADGDPHDITFQPGSTAWEFCSERVRREISWSGRDLERLYRASREQWQPITKEYADHLFDQAAALARQAAASERQRSIAPLVGEDEALEPPRAIDGKVRPEGTAEVRAVRIPESVSFDPRQAKSLSEVLLRTSELLSVTLGVTLVIAGAPRPSTE